MRQVDDYRHDLEVKPGQDRLQVRERAVDEYDGGNIRCSIWRNRHRLLPALHVPLIFSCLPHSLAGCSRFFLLLDLDYTDGNKSGDYLPLIYPARDYARSLRKNI